MLLARKKLSIDSIKKNVNLRLTCHELEHW